MKSEKANHTNMPLISILMATYEPREDWLRSQLESLNGQSYPNLRLYIRDDASAPEKAERLKKIVGECITAFPCEIACNGENLGSNRTFEKLTGEAQGEYFAYCDQDDIWRPNKLSRLQQAMEETGAQLVCSDMQIIDTAGKKIADSITRVRRHHVFRSGKGLAESLLTRNFATGCATLVRADTARAAVPFCPYMVHDHYLALFCAERGEVISLPETLLQYRLHGENQTELLREVTDRRSYGEVRIETLQNRFRWLQEHFACREETGQALAEAGLWADARYDNWHGRGGKADIWKYRKFSPAASLLEIVGSALPEKLFQLGLKAAKKNKI